MKLSYSFKWALLISYLVVALIVYLFVRQIRGEIRPLYLESVEQILVDQANLLAAWLSEQEQVTLNPQALGTHFDPVFKNLKARRPQALIYRHLKNQIDTQVYVTDDKGIVVYDSENQAVGQDYTKWRDVALTLSGRYGARSSPWNPAKPSSNRVLHVAAPIERDGEILGVVTVRKPTVDLLLYIDSAKSRFVWFGLGLVALVLLMGLLAVRLFARPLTRLTQYARDVRDGKPARLPKFRQREARQTSQAIEEMRQSLEGKKYVEHYVQNLTHELKTPLTSLLGAAELLEENQTKQGPRAQEIQTRLLHNIESESQRLKSIVERMLDLSVLEAREELSAPEPIVLDDLVTRVVAILKSQKLSQEKRLNWQWSPPENTWGEISGDPFLLEAALRNALQNAVEFSPQEGCIEILLEKTEGFLSLKISDQGPGVPDYAVDKVWEKFYSLPRPETGRKSSGLGLSFVSQVMKLHHGRASLQNLKSGGAQVILSFSVEESRF